VTAVNHPIALSGTALTLRATATIPARPCKISKSGSRYPSPGSLMLIHQRKSRARNSLNDDLIHREDGDVRTSSDRGTTSQWKCHGPI